MKKDYKNDLLDLKTNNSYHIFYCVTTLIMITLSPLPYSTNALEPVIDTQTVELHYGKHHQGYVNKLNELIADTGFKDRELEEIVKTSD